MCATQKFRNTVAKTFLFLLPIAALSLEQDIPDYEMDSADEIWVQSKTDLTPYKFEQMMDRLEKITVCSLDDAKALVKRNEVNQDVFDYWVSKRLKTVSRHSIRISHFGSNLIAQIFSETPAYTDRQDG